jgi:hypothetical protein
MNLVIFGVNLAHRESWRGQERRMFYVRRDTRGEPSEDRKSGCGPTRTLRDVRFPAGCLWRRPSGRAAFIEQLDHDCGPSGCLGLFGIGLKMTNIEAIRLKALGSDNCYYRR